MSGAGFYFKVGLKIICRFLTIFGCPPIPQWVNKACELCWFASNSVPGLGGASNDYFFIVYSTVVLVNRLLSLSCSIKMSKVLFTLLKCLM